MSLGYDASDALRSYNSVEEQTYEMSELQSFVEDDTEVNNTTSSNSPSITNNFENQSNTDIV